MPDSNITRPRINRINLVIDCPDAGVLAAFYSKLLGWEWTHPQAGGWAAITSPEGKDFSRNPLHGTLSSNACQPGTVIAFQEVGDYVPPVWPWEKGKQGQMLHLDFWVDDLEEGVAFALACGATQAGTQYYATSRTLLDPAGHPFCIDTEGEEPEA